MLDSVYKTLHKTASPPTTLQPRQAWRWSLLELQPSLNYLQFLSMQCAVSVSVCWFTLFLSPGLPPPPGGIITISLKEVLWVHVCVSLLSL